MLVEGWLARAARARPGHTALQTPQASRSYAQLDAAAAAGSEQLAARGAGPGARVAIALADPLAFAEALHACLRLGAVAVPLDMRLAAGERERLAAGCALVLDEPLDGARPARRAGGDGRAGRAAGDSRARPAAGSCTHDLDAPAVVIHTSGTTSTPRPVELTYGNLLWSALGSAAALGSPTHERWLCALPLSHVGGLSIVVRSAIYATTAVLHERFEADRVLHALAREQVTLVSLVATTLARLLDAGLERPPGLRCALTGGGPVPPALVERATGAGLPVALTYGLSEACSQVSTTPLADLARGRAVPGPPLFCTRVGIAGDGEILVAGPTVARGAAGADGWLHTGDLGSLDSEGRLHVSGRKADTIISGGENVAPAEVEAVLEAHPGVREAAVFARADPQWGEAVCATVVPVEGAAPEPDELRSHCAGLLAPYKVPKRFELSSAPLPRTSSGKLLRRELR